ncbi:hypothetical protein KBC75_03620 [Candidatus Shapirobacteria bacterium]|nr:hypothetical protein [Candidatus Shapirobacteria bacterium]
MRRIFISFILVSSFSFLVSTIAAPVYAQAPAAWAGRCVAQGDVATIQGFECLFYNVLQIVTYAAGVAFLFMFITGGFQYLYSSNDAKKVAGASATLTMAIAGLVGLIASWFILRLIQNFTGANVTNFIIPG